MSDSIVLSQSIRRNLLSLQDTADLLGRTQNRLATGKKVNTALDNPTNFFNASGLNARAGDLSRLLDGLGQSVKTLETADNGIRAITRLVETAQAMARQALNAPSTTPKVESTRKMAATDVLTAAPLSVAAGSTIQITIGAVGPQTFTIAAGQTVQQFIDSINTNATFNVPGQPPTVRASLDSFGKLRVESLNGGAMTWTASTAAANAALLGDNAGVPPVATLNPTGALNAQRTSFANQIVELMNQIDGLARDASYNGINLLNGQSMRVIFNEDNTTAMDVTGVTFDADGIGINAPIANLQSDADIGTMQAELDTAMRTLRAQAATFGANMTVIQTRQDFTKNSVLTLNTGADQLVLADQNEEGANLLALNTRQQLSIQALSLANQADQGILRLF